jgi:hypothetical protein
MSELQSILGMPQEIMLFGLARRRLCLEMPFQGFWETCLFIPSCVQDETTSLVGRAAGCVARSLEILADLLVACALPIRPPSFAHESHLERNLELEVSI